MRGIYAQDTSVSVDQSKIEIEKTIRRYGATDCISGWGRNEQGDVAFVAFRIDGVPVRIDIPLPSRKDPEFTTTSTGRERCEEAARKAWEQACRARWRALVLLLKAQLEAVSSGLVTFRSMFLPWVMLPGGQTVSQKLVPQIEDVLAGKNFPLLLPAPGGDR